MLQFAIGLSYINIAWLVGDQLGATVYNAPPLFFIAGLTLLFSGFYSFTLKGEMVRFVLIIGTLGVASAFIHGITFWHFRQIIAFAVAAMVWVYLYQEGGLRDIYSLETTHKILWVYFAFAILAIFERYLFDTASLSYLVGSIFSFHPGSIVEYVLAPGKPRLAYFSNEPSSAAYAIAAVIFPYITANVVVKRTPAAYLTFMAACFVLYFAEGLTSQILIVFSIGFLIAPRLTVLMVPVLMATVAIGILRLIPMLDDRGAIIQFLLNTLSGISSRIDTGLLSGSYLSRLSTWFIGAKTFAQSPILGQGFGGTAANFFALANSGYDVFFTQEQREFYLNDAVPFNAQMIFRIPAELGVVGVAILLFYARRAFRYVFAPVQGDPLCYYAFLYAFGAMLLCFNLAGEYFNPLISAFVVLLAQMLRKRKGEASTAVARVSPVGPIPEPNL